MHSAVKKTMYINNVLTKLRVSEGILREKLELSKKDWKQAKKKYGLFHIYHQHQDENEFGLKSGDGRGGVKEGNERDV